MNRTALKWILGVLLLLIGGGSLVYWDTHRDKSSHAREELKSRNREIKEIETAQRSLALRLRSLAGSGRCKEEEDCGVFGLGAKLCDGYPEFVFYSIRDADPDALRDVVNAYNSNMVRLNNLTLGAQHCGKAMPRVRCIQERCVGIAR